MLGLRLTNLFVLISLSDMFPKTYIQQSSLVCYYHNRHHHRLCTGKQTFAFFCDDPAAIVRRSLPFNAIAFDEGRIRRPTPCAGHARRLCRHSHQLRAHASGRDERRADNFRPAPTKTNGTSGRAGHGSHT